jgi:hypothetical protein
MEALYILLSVLYFCQLVICCCGLLFDGFETKKKFIKSLIPFYWLYVLFFYVIIKKFKELE